MNISKSILCAAAVATACTASAVVVRKLPPMTVVENETVSIDSNSSTAVRSTNVSVFTGALRESGEAVVSGVRLGEAQLNFVDSRGVFATRTVTVVPGYWDMLKKMFSEDPEIAIEIVGDKVVVSGATANVDTLRRVEQIKNLDTSRIVTQVTYSPVQIGELVKDFLERSNVSNITVNVIGREVCLVGRMYDVQSIEQLKARVTNFLKDFPGISVNTDSLRIIKQKIMIGIEFLAYNTTMAKNLGFQGPESITAKFSSEFSYDNTQSDGDRSYTYKSGAKMAIDEVNATINLLKKNGAARQVYTTTLSTQSGVEAEFQKGGTLHKSTSDVYKRDMKEIEYGYIIKATPLIVDPNTVNLDFDLDLKKIKNNSQDGDVDVDRYQTKSKYIVRPGESIVLSGYNYRTDDQVKRGTPFLSKIPWIGEWLFGNTTDGMEADEMMLVVTVNWALEEDAAEIQKKKDALRNKSVEVEMP